MIFTFLDCKTKISSFPRLISGDHMSMSKLILCFSKKMFVSALAVSCRNSPTGLARYLVKTKKAPFYI